MRSVNESDAIRIAPPMHNKNKKQIQIRSSFAIAQEGLPPLLRTFDRNEETGCWEWTAYVSPTTSPSGGYGFVRYGDGRSGELAHRAVFQVLVGDLPEDREVDHLCRVRHCVNPDHLDVVTHAENMRRAVRTSGPAQVVAAYYTAAKLAGNTRHLDPRSRAILGAQAKALIHQDDWPVQAVVRAVKRFAKTQRNPSFLREWCRINAADERVTAHVAKMEAEPRDGGMRAIAKAMKEAGL